MKTACLFLKAPRVGAVKTRLARDIGAEHATTIYRALAERQARTIPAGWAVSVHFSPADASEEVRTWLEPHASEQMRLTPQCEGDLGHRLATAVVHEFECGATRLFLLGGDCPEISCEYLVEADNRLNENDVVIGPAIDGGYVLLGIKAPTMALFENITWSTSIVLEQTLAAVRRKSLSVALLPTLEDIDDAVSLKRQSRFMVS